MDRYNEKIVPAALSCALALAGCEGSDPTVGADVLVIDQRIQALTAAQIDYVNGTYSAGCTGAVRSGLNWSVRVSGNTALPNRELDVIQGDDFAMCKLAITEVHNTNGDALIASAPIVLDVTYGSAVSFARMGMPIQFYANAVIGAGNYDGPIAITLLFSDNPMLNTASTTASFAVVAATISPVSVPAPNYTLSLGTVAVTTDLPGKVVTVTGNAELTAGSALGEKYVQINGPVNDTYAEIKTAYDGALPATNLALTIPASNLLALNTNLTGGVVRTIIVSHEQDGVISFQKFAITFNPPPP